MGYENIKGKTIYKGSNKVEHHYRLELSKRIIQKYGEGPFADQKMIRDILLFCLDYYLSEFKKIIHNETSLEFYRNIFCLHEEATHIAINIKLDELPSPIDGAYIAKYRRILKMIIEEATEINIKNIEEDPPKFSHRLENTLDKLLLLGEFAMICVGSYAEQDMIEDVIDITFDKNGLYVFGRRHHYDYIIQEIAKDWGPQLNLSVSDPALLDDFKSAFSNSFNIQYEEFTTSIAFNEHHQEKKFGLCPPYTQEMLTTGLEYISQKKVPSAELLFDGLTLNKGNKMDLLKLLCYPYKLNRMLYRPIISWTIEGSQHLMIGKESFAEAIIQLNTNAIPWGKAPEEWISIESFKEFVHCKENEHSLWLEDKLEEIIKKINIPYDRNVLSLKTSKSKSTRIDTEGLGEIDFICILPKQEKILLIDCKNLLGRFDMVNQKNDFNAFTKTSSNNKSYNQKANNKLTWFNTNKNLLEAHFKQLYPSINIDYSRIDIEFVFVINSPTFYMYNAEFRIYTVGQIESVLEGKYQDKTFLINLEEDDKITVMNVKYPYFQKPDYRLFDPTED